MKADSHPAYQTINVKCGCGHTFSVGSVLTSDLNIDVCDQCHPFYTGKQKIVDTAGRVDKFYKQFTHYQNKTAG